MKPNCCKFFYVVQLILTENFYFGTRMSVPKVNINYTDLYFSHNRANKAKDTIIHTVGEVISIRKPYTVSTAKVTLDGNESREKLVYFLQLPPEIPSEDFFTGIHKGRKLTFRVIHTNRNQDNFYLAMAFLLVPTVRFAEKQLRIQVADTLSQIRLEFENDAQSVYNINTLASKLYSILEEWNSEQHTTFGHQANAKFDFRTFLENIETSIRKCERFADHVEEICILEHLYQVPIYVYDENGEVERVPSYDLPNTSIALRHRSRVEETHDELVHHDVYDALELFTLS